MNPEPSGPPWRKREEIGAEETAARGVYAPAYALSYGPPGAVAVAPGDVRGTVLILERCDGYCCGLDGKDGPNLACVAACDLRPREGQPIQSRALAVGRHHCWHCSGPAQFVSVCRTMCSCP
ncbi:hypothetical protein GCM10018965_069060 [Nonomuraea roseola]